MDSMNFKLGAHWRGGIIQEALTFDDILMIPVHSSIDSRSNCNLNTKFSKNIPLKIPLVSSPMDTVTEYEMAIGMAQQGGIGILHRFLSINEQVDMVKKVKRSEGLYNTRPYLVGVGYTISKVKSIIQEFGVKTFLVTDDESIPHNYNQQTQSKQLGQTSPSRRKSDSELECIINSFIIMFSKVILKGIFTSRDLKAAQSENDLVGKLMTPIEKIVLIDRSVNQPERKECIELMHVNKIQKLVCVRNRNLIDGLMFLKDIEADAKLKRANRDPYGQLYVGAAVGAREDDIERAVKLINAGCNVLVLDIANGHSDVCIQGLERLKQVTEGTSCDVVAGSIATGEGAYKLIKAGADGIRCGIGNGSICTTRLVSGCGVPQFTALMDVAPICKEYEIPLISDGGNRNSGNMCKALAVGADCVMLGRLVAGCDEGPSKVIYREGKLQKVYRGMAGYGANVAKAQRMGTVEPGNTTFTPEGVEGYIPYAGPLENVITQFTKGIQSGMSYSGANTIQELQKNVRFIKMTSAGFKESGVHDISKI